MKRIGVVFFQIFRSPGPRPIFHVGKYKRFSKSLQKTFNQNSSGFDWSSPGHHVWKIRPTFTFGSWVFSMFRTFLFFVLHGNATHTHTCCNKTQHSGTKEQPRRNRLELLDRRLARTCNWLPIPCLMPELPAPCFENKNISL